MRSLRCAAMLVTVLNAGAALAQSQGAVSDYRVASPPPLQPILQTAAAPSVGGAVTPAFLPPPADPRPGVVYMPVPPRPALPTAGGPLDESPPISAWARAEALLWWVHGKSLPPIFTTSPPGTPVTQAGVLGTPGATTVFGGEDPITNPRWGGRLTAGVWINGAALIGLEGSYFRLGSRSAGATVGGAADPISSRPFFNAAGFNDAELVTFPGVLAGSASATLDATSLSGADAAVRVPVWIDPCNARPRLDLLAGYRWLHYGEDFGVREDLLPLGGAFAPGTNIVVLDRFRVRSDFHGAMLGLGYGDRVGAFTLDITGRASVGYLSRRVDIDGSTTVSVPGGAPVVSVGGLLAQRSNIGGYDKGKWTVIPELEMRLGYDVTSSLRLTAGYSLLVLSDFYRVGNVIDTTVNRNLIPPTGDGTGPQRPAFSPSDGAIWVHGLSLGAELRF
jgi:hypothetical protein